MGSAWQNVQVSWNWDGRVAPKSFQSPLNCLPVFPAIYFNLLVLLMWLLYTLDMIPSFPCSSSLPPLVPMNCSCIWSSGLSRDFWKDMKHGSQSIVRNIVQIDKGWAEKLGSQVLHGVKVLLHGRACLPQDMETVREIMGNDKSNIYHCQLWLPQEISVLWWHRDF